MTRIIRVCLKPFRAAYWALGGEMYAVIQTGGKQYRVAPGDTIRIERVEGKIGEKVTVTGKLVQEGRAKKLTVFKYKRTHQYKSKRGHRQDATAVQGSDIKI